MFDYDMEKPPQEETFPRNLEGLSLSELEEYIDRLKAEIRRAEGDIERKKTSQAAAQAAFK